MGSKHRLPIIIHPPHIYAQRGAVVEWLERLSYGAESVKREFQVRLCHAMTEKLSVNPVVNGYFFPIREG